MASTVSLQLATCMPIGTSPFLHTVSSCLLCGIYIVNASRKKKKKHDKAAWLEQHKCNTGLGFKLTNISNATGKVELRLKMGANCKCMHNYNMGHF